MVEQQAMRNVREDGLSQLASETVHYNPLDLSTWLESMFSEFNPCTTFYDDSSSSLILLPSPIGLVKLLIKRIGYWISEISDAKISDIRSFQIGYRISDILISDTDIRSENGFRIGYPIRAHPNCQSANRWFLNPCSLPLQFDADFISFG
ncbi:uncharacterized protein LOC110739341 [Chenopodium quinoa]|uniref:uncharacterized protein LOC110739341 n=1 Tax=Chenopodium quinoa TaxID=63459 RepID=UPI000B76E474|nr:uncharacterized protein LOC110739341 [Chenopodium quinoa]